ncbi:PREDICTED: agamous-like MADS-box protein AGL29 [Tarenaya hassleriana]|uniref:agamous-like MADS-box protein AGL29 n=1 Tax=Tarenaya hassleriana TaxID=28532 RepID=UPI00053C42E5|nr:PREDICTED: agamous-like MADS-box protein AGL29 [Tarenaya hassleriana]
MVFSPEGKPYSYGDSSQHARLQNSQAYLRRLEDELQIEKFRGEFLKEKLKETRERNNIKDVNDMNLGELYEFKSKLEALRQMVYGRALEMEASSRLTMLSQDKTPNKPEGSKPRKKSKNKNKKKKY